MVQEKRENKNSDAEYENIDRGRIDGSISPSLSNNSRFAPSIACVVHMYSFFRSTVTGLSIHNSYFRPFNYVDKRAKPAHGGSCVASIF